MAYDNLFSIPVSRKTQTSMRRKFIIFSSVLFLLIFALGSMAFFLIRRQILHENAGNELTQVVEIEKLKLEAYVNSEITIVQKMAASPLIQEFFLHPEDEGLARIALEEIEGYRRAFMSNSLFWVRDADKKFHRNNIYVYDINPNDPEQYWYNLTLYETKTYNFNINYNSDLNLTNLWINAPVFNKEQKAVGMVGTGLDMTDFIIALMTNKDGPEELYFFNAAGEITGARDVKLVTNKILLNNELGQTGEEILAEARNLNEGETRYFEINDLTGVAAFCRIPALDWYIAAVHRFTIADTLKTGMALLFGVMMVIILIIFAGFNVFAFVLLEPLNRLIKTLGQISVDWDLNPQNEMKKKDEVETLGEFLNMTIIDQLTGIFNRRFLYGHLKRIIKALSRSGGKLSLLFIDIDFFKNYNDTYGHDAGDVCLKAVANALAQCITRSDDFAARYGGEEFTVVLPNTDEKGAALIAERILKKVYDCKIPHESSEIARFITVSVGGTTCKVKYSHTERDILKCADEALYVSKREGRNRYTFKSLE